MSEVDETMNNIAVQQIINFYKDEFKNNIRIALKPFMIDLKNPLRIDIVFGEK